MLPWGHISIKNWPYCLSVDRMNHKIKKYDTCTTQTIMCLRVSKNKIELKEDELC
jgi:hypothetical protein